MGPIGAHEEPGLWLVALVSVVARLDVKSQYSQTTLAPLLFAVWKGEVVVQFGSTRVLGGLVLLASLDVLREETFVLLVLLDGQWALSSGRIVVGTVIVALVVVICRCAKGCLLLLDGTGQRC